MSTRDEVRLWLTQRVTAMLLGFCVVVHLATIVYAVRGGLSAADILSRTRGSAPWRAFYVVFVLAAAAHGAIGLRGIAIEWLGLGKTPARAFMWLAGLALAGLGLRAVYAVVRT